MYKEVIESGFTIEEATAKAKKELNAPLNKKVNIKVVATPKKHLFSQDEPAKVKASYLDWDTCKIIEFGSFPQEDRFGKIYEPIKWFPLTKIGESTLLISEKCLYNIAYTSKARCSWKSSFLNEWLNSTFYNTAFDDSEKQKIVGDVTILSFEDLIKYFEPLQEELKSIPTKFSFSTMYNVENDEYDSIVENSVINEEIAWWLKPNNNDYIEFSTTNLVSKDGGVITEQDINTAQWMPLSHWCMVRPVILVNL